MDHVVKTQPPPLSVRSKTILNKRQAVNVRHQNSELFQTQLLRQEVKHKTSGGHLDHFQNKTPVQSF